MQHYQNSWIFYLSDLGYKHGFTTPTPKFCKFKAFLSLSQNSFSSWKHQYQTYFLKQVFIFVTKIHIKWMNLQNQNKLSVNVLPYWLYHGSKHVDFSHFMCFFKNFRLKIPILIFKLNSTILIILTYMIIMWVFYAFF